MPERRMFTKKITESDSFLEMPMSTQVLYFHLSMNADDDGFNNAPKKTQRIVGASDDDFKLLLAKKFIIAFESGVIAIKHWKMHNYLRSDRYKPTDYVEEKAMLSLDEKNAYTLNLERYPNGIPTVSIGKDRLGKDSIGKDREEDKKNNYIYIPTLDEVDEYCFEENLNIDPEHFIAYYNARGWKSGNNDICDWKSLAKAWHYNKEHQDE